MWIFGRRHAPPLTPQELDQIGREARTQRLNVPVARIVNALAQVGERWADPDYGLRREMLQLLPRQVGFTPAMLAKELDGFAGALRQDALQAKLRRELANPDLLDHWQGQPALKAFPLGVVLHVSSGNVATAGVLSMVEGLLTKNINLLKTSGEALFPLAFLETLLAVDPEVAGSLAILTWPGKEAAMHQALLPHVDGVVAWGSEEAVTAYRRDLAVGTRWIEFGPRVSCALISREADPGQAARGLALDLCLWDQNACSSPQVAYVEGNPDPLLQALTRELQALSDNLPMAPLTIQEAAEVTKEREMARFESALGFAELLTPGNQDWTLIVEKDPQFKLSPLMRTLYVKPIEDLAQVPALLMPYQRYLQTVGAAVPPERMLELADQLVEVGALRLTALGRMSDGFPGEPHDGVHTLRQLVKYVSVDHPALAGYFDPHEWEPQQADDLAAKQQELLLHVGHTPFWQERLLGLQEPWIELPLLDKATLVTNTPPDGEGLLVEPPLGAHWLRSGGSTGNPKVSLFSYDDYEADMRRGARGAFAVGLRPGHRVANLFMAGRLYGSFLSTNRMLELLGCSSFPLTSAAPAEEILDAIRAFHIDTVIGLPSHVAPMLEELVALGVKRFFYTGEHFYDADQWRDRLTIGSIGYGTVDAGPIGHQCPFTRGGIHHLHSDHIYLEILDPVTHLPAEEGEVVVTTLNRRLMPLLRYRLGDRARWVSGHCSCGRHTPLFELLGRMDDLVVVGGLNLTYADVQQSVGRPCHLDISRAGGVDRVTVWTTSPAPDRDQILETLTELGKAVRGGHLRLDVETTKELPIQPRTGKVIRIRDRRLES